MIKRLLIWINIFIATLGAVIAVCLTPFWIRSYSEADICFVSPAWGWRYQMMTVDGRLLFQILFGRPKTPEPFFGHHVLSQDDGRAFAPWMHGKFDIPLYLLVPIAATISCSIFFLYFRDRRRKRQRQVASCSKCGYDLRAHQPGDKCPECGTLIPPAV